ncbi:hypothetical protein [Silvibacterium sp.]|uniref:hypothetical protein n=1 Tax=Silvibacterium sp. TaxID=1964179 RepID=UPI0039E4A1D2
MALLSPSNDTRVNLLLLLADLRVQQKVGAAPVVASTPESPLFAWDSLVDTFGTQGDKTELKGNGIVIQDGSAPCPAATPASDPFTAAVQADHTLQPEERNTLLAARKAMSGCAGNAGNANTSAGNASAPMGDAGAVVIAAAEKAMKTASGKAYAVYLDGASAFWRNDYDRATAVFPVLANHAQPAWVKESSTYMAGRVLINRAQVGAFDEYGGFKKGWKADAATVDAAEAALDTYLRLYPKGVYAQSARGLKRRGYWLAQDVAKLDAEYGALLLLSPADRNVSDVDLVQEIDNKLTGSAYSENDRQRALQENAAMSNVRSTLLLAMLDLAEMRTAEKTNSGYGVSIGPPITRDALEAQKPYFAGQMPLYEYLRAVHAFYVENKPEDVLHMIPDAARQTSFSYVQFSRQALRGMALEAVRDHNALGFWTQMLQGAKAPYQRAALELAIAYHDERAGKVQDVFAPDSPVRYPYLRQVLLANIADAGLLRAQATNRSAPQRERDIALFTLLYKEATRGYAADFLKDLALVPSKAPTDGSFMLDGEVDEYFVGENAEPAAIPLGIFLNDKRDENFGCPALRASEAKLVQNADDPTAKLCVADFVRLNQYGYYGGGSSPSSDDLGGTQSLFPGSEFVRMETYTAVLANPKSSRNDKAYALYRAVNCYAPSGNNDCGGKDVPKAQRKAWFMSLKHDYASTQWADDLEYYW